MWSFFLYQYIQWASQYILLNLICSQLSDYVNCYQGPQIYMTFLMFWDLSISLKTWWNDWYSPITKISQIQAYTRVHLILRVFRDFIQNFPHLTEPHSYTFCVKMTCSSEIYILDIVWRGNVSSNKSGERESCDTSENQVWCQNTVHIWLLARTTHLEIAAKVLYGFVEVPSLLDFGSSIFPVVLSKL
jgi:hypothetical protein